MFIKSAAPVRVLALIALLVGASVSCLAQTVPTAQMTPTPTKREWMADRKLFVEVSTGKGEGPAAYEPAAGWSAENYAIRIGNVVPVRVRIYVIEPKAGEAKAEVDFANLKAGRLSIQPQPDPDFTVADASLLPLGVTPLSVAPPKAAVLKVGAVEYKAQVHEIVAYVQTMRIPQPMVFTLEFRYAVKKLASGKGFDWQATRSPAYVLSMSRTADNGTDLSDGNTALAVAEPPVGIAIMLLVAGAALTLLVLINWLIGFVRARANAVIQIDPEMIAWRKLMPLYSAARTGKGFRFTEAQVRQLVAIVLAYSGYVSLSAEQLDRLKFEDDDGQLLYAILYPLMHGVLEVGQPLSDERYGEIVIHIASLIPQPAGCGV